MDDKFYRVQSLYEAAFLLVKGYKLAGKENNGAKVTLLFNASNNLIKDSLHFYNGGEAGAKELFDAYRTLKDYVFTK